MTDILDEGKMIISKFQELTNRVKYSDYLMPFGKYKGEFIADILVEDPDYLIWASENITGEVKEAIDYHLKGDQK